MLLLLAVTFLSGSPQATPLTNAVMLDPYPPLTGPVAPGLSRPPAAKGFFLDKESMKNFTNFVGNVRQGSTDAETRATRYLVDDGSLEGFSNTVSSGTTDELTVVSELRAALSNSVPKTWTLTSVVNGQVRPINLAVSSGIEATALRNGYKAEDSKRGQGGEVHVWLMSRGYMPGKPVAPQVGAAWEVGVCRGYRVFLWRLGGSDWPTLEGDIKSALLRLEAGR